MKNLVRIVNLSYSVPRPPAADPEAWMEAISFQTGILESLTRFAEVIGVYHIHYKGVVQRNRVTYHFTGLKRWQLLLPFGFNMYVRRLNPDVAIVHGLISPWQVLLLRWIVGDRLIIIEQHHAERPFVDYRSLIQKWADKFVDAYLFASSDLGRLWVEKRQINDPRKVKEIMGSSSHFFPMEKIEARSFTGVKGDLVFLWVGDLDQNKDPFLAVRAFIRLARKHKGVMLYMIYQSRKLEDVVKAQIEKADGQDWIHLVGAVHHKELQYWFNSADFILSCSHYEGSGIAVCEAMSCGCVPVLTDIPSFRMMTDNGRIGRLYPAGDEDKLVSALMESLSIDRPVERGKVLRRFQDELSFNANARKIMAVINETRSK